MEILTSVKRLYISYKSPVNDFVYSFGRAALLLLVEVENHTVPVRERRRIRVILPLFTRPFSYSLATITIIGYESGLSATQHSWLDTANLYTDNPHPTNKPCGRKKIELSSPNCIPEVRSLKPSEKSCHVCFFFFFRNRGAFKWWKNAYYCGVAAGCSLQILVCTEQRQTLPDILGTRFHSLWLRD